MKKIGVTPTGSFIVELTPDEVQVLERIQSFKPGDNPAPATPPQATAPPTAMTIAERIEYAAPRIRKLHPAKAEGVARSIFAMFALKGGVSDEEVRQTVAGLQKAGALKIDAKDRVTYPEAKAARYRERQRDLINVLKEMEAAGLKVTRRCLPRCRRLIPTI